MWQSRISEMWHQLWLLHWRSASVTVLSPSIPLAILTGHLSQLSTVATELSYPESFSQSTLDRRNGSNARAFLSLTGKKFQVFHIKFMWFFCGFRLVFKEYPCLEKVPFFQIWFCLFPCVELLFQRWKTYFHWNNNNNYHTWTSTKPYME